MPQQRAVPMLCALCAGARNHRGSSSPTETEFGGVVAQAETGVVVTFDVQKGDIQRHAKPHTWSTDMPTCYTIRQSRSGGHFRRYAALLAILLSLSGISTVSGQTHPAGPVRDGESRPWPMPGEPAFDRVFSHRKADVNGVRLHYVIGGQGEPLVLLHAPLSALLPRGDGGSSSALYRPSACGPSQDAARKYYVIHVGGGGSVRVLRPSPPCNGGATRRRRHSARIAEAIAHVATKFPATKLIVAQTSKVGRPAQAISARTPYYTANEISL